MKATDSETDIGEDKEALSRIIGQCEGQGGVKFKEKESPRDTEQLNVV